MEPGEWKPVLAALALPPAAPLLLALLGLLIATRRRGFGLALAFAGVLSLTVLSTNAGALLLARHLLPPVAPLAPQQAAGAQAIVILGGGVLAQAPEYGLPQPGEHTLARLRYGVHLARQTGLPLAFAGGIGWSAAGTVTASEGSVARRVLQEDYGIAPRWVDDRSRDTRENALHMAQLLRPAGVRRIVLVTDASHVPRAAAEFRAAGFEVLPAPTGFPIVRDRPLLEWLPSAHGLASSRTLLREWLARRVAAKVEQP
jgi:uncharacterized SAM-binding protein YcdF (DUF218 family)